MFSDDLPLEANTAKAMSAKWIDVQLYHTPKPILENIAKTMNYYVLATRHREQIEIDTRVS